MSWDHHHTSYMEQVEHVVVYKLQTILSLLYQRVLRKDISIDSLFGTQNPKKLTKIWLCFHLFRCFSYQTIFLVETQILVYAACSKNAQNTKKEKSISVLPFGPIRYKHINFGVWESGGHFLGTLRTDGRTDVTDRTSGHLSSISHIYLVIHLD